VGETWPRPRTTAPTCCRSRRKDCELGPCPPTTSRSGPRSSSGCSGAQRRHERSRADHSNDSSGSMPPPHESVRGIDAYRDTWPPVFEWQAQGAPFEIVSLDVTAGDDVAYAAPCCAAELHRAHPRAAQGAGSMGRRTRVGVSRALRTRGPCTPPLPPRAVSGNEWCTGSTAPPRKT
jgi:hypothetical protein